MFWFRFDSDSDDGWSLFDPPATARPARTAPTCETPRRPVRTSLTLAPSRPGRGAGTHDVVIEYAVGPDAGALPLSVVLTLHDVRGRIVRTLKNRRGESATGRVNWDGRDAFGTPVEAGLYYARLLAGGIVRLTSVVIED